MQLHHFILRDSNLVKPEKYEPNSLIEVMKKSILVFFIILFYLVYRHTQSFTFQTKLHTSISFEGCIITGVVEVHQRTLVSKTFLFTQRYTLEPTLKMNSASMNPRTSLQIQLDQVNKTREGTHSLSRYWIISSKTQTCQVWQTWNITLHIL